MNDYTNIKSTLPKNEIPYTLDENWKWYKWGDIIQDYQQGLIRSNSELNDDYSIEYFKMNFINENGDYSFKGLPKTEASRDEILRYKIREGDFFINVRNSRELVGKTCAIYNVLRDIVFNHMLVRIKHKNYITGTFMSAYFNTKFGKQILETCKKGTTTVIALYQKDLYNLPVPIPNEKLLKKIDKIYNDINKKIQLLHQINDNLAELAKTIYDYWFLQFDFPDENGKPYKTSGGKMVYNGILKREIPKGWEVKKLKKYAFIKKGTLITEKQTNTYGNIKVVSAGLDFSYYHDKSNFLENTITISASGANAGFINFWREPIFACDCTTVRGNNLTETLYIYQFLKILQDYIYQQAKGSAQPHIYPKDIEELNITIPNENKIKKYGEYVNDLNQKILINLQQIHHLQSLRDWLLPMLMNGQVSVE